MVFDVILDIMSCFPVFLLTRKVLVKSKVPLHINLGYFIMLKLLSLIQQALVDQLVCDRHFGAARTNEI